MLTRPDDALGNVGSGGGLGSCFYITNPTLYGDIGWHGLELIQNAWFFLLTLETYEPTPKQVRDYP